MSNRPTYEELEQRIQRLANEVVAHERFEDELERIYDFSLDLIASGNLEVISLE